jgi:hypothetical protein
MPLPLVIGRTFGGRRTFETVLVRVGLEGLEHGAGVLARSAGSGSGSGRDSRVVVLVEPRSETREVVVLARTFETGLV